MSSFEKIRPFADLAELGSSLRAANRTIVLTHGVFDLLHVGVIRHLEHARSLGDALVVALVPDGQSPPGRPRPLFPQDVRAEALACLRCVDQVVIGNSASALDAIRLLRPNVAVPWGDDSDSGQGVAEFSGSEAAAVRAVGGRVLPPPGNALRSAELIHHHPWPALPPEAGAFLGAFCSRHKIGDVTACLEKSRGAKVLFVGEAIIDEYQYCETLGKSGKEPILATRYLSSEKFAGGVLATANQAAAFCDHVGLLTLLGTQDSHEAFIRERINPAIDASFLFMPGAPTIVKRRMVERYPLQKLFEIYFMEPNLPEAVSRDVHARLETLLPRYDAVAVTDYGHGMMTPEIIDLLCDRARFLAVNTQLNAANQGFNTVSKYRRADFICLSERELRVEAQDRTTDLKLVMARTAEKLSCPRMLITRGPQGCLGYHAGCGYFAIPAFTNRIVDRVGAGDALLAVSALCAATGAPMDVVGFIGNAVGAQAVQTVGNRAVVVRHELERQIHSLMNYDHWLTTP